MDTHENARTTPHSRMLIVMRLREGWRVSAVASAFGIDARTVRKWRDRYAAEGERGLRDRSSRPHRSPLRLPETAEAEIEGLRRRRLSGPAIASRAITSAWCAIAASAGITFTSASTTHRAWPTPSFYPTSARTAPSPS